MTSEISPPGPRPETVREASNWPTSQFLVAVLAIVGALAVVVQAWGYASWLASPNFSAVTSPQVPPETVTSGVARAQLLSVAGTILWLGYVARDSWRRRTLTWPALWTVAWSLVFWQEPFVNIRNHTFSFNKEFFNRGDWTTHLPFVPDSYSPLPEAILLEGLVFVYLLPLVGLGTAALMRALRRYARITSPLALVLAAWLAVGLFDLAFERQGISGGLLAYVELGGPALDKGEPTQWPIYEGLGIGLAWAVPGIVMFFRRDAPDPGKREITPRWWHGRRASLITVLAAVGLVNLVFAIYNAGYLAIMDGTVAEMPAWLGATS